MSVVDKPLPVSWLFTPANRPDRFDKALSLGAEAVIIDLEDAVPPAQKPEARAAAATWLAERADGACKVAVRINRPESEPGREDLAALRVASRRIDFIVVPKAESPDEIRRLDKALADAGWDARLIAMIETARGLVAVEAIAESSPRLAALMFGLADYAADIGARVETLGADWPRARIVNAAALGRIAAIDSPIFDLRDIAARGAECAASKAAGFAGKAAIHPSQIAPINRAFRPSAADLAVAERIIEAAAAGVGVVDGRMIDEAMARWARRVRAQALYAKSYS